MLKLQQTRVILRLKEEKGILGFVHLVVQNNRDDIWPMVYWWSTLSLSVQAKKSNLTGAEKMAGHVPRPVVGDDHSPNGT